MYRDEQLVANVEVDHGAYGNQGIEQGPIREGSFFQVQPDGSQAS